MVAAFSPESRLRPEHKQAFNHVLAYATAASDNGYLQDPVTL